ncbi:MAG: GTP-binding protein [Candidatus Lokiarchaeota archaeon]|nr:GTP-binding protein [Candidatus Lokiarchaeota archaeon]
MTEAAFIYKICVIGNGGVGKTSAVKRYSQDVFSEDYQVTVGVQHSSQTIEIDGEDGPMKVKTIVWDLGGQDKFKFVRPMFYRAARGLVLMFDITDKKSFEDLPKWIKEAESNIGQSVPIILVANKIDLDNHAIEIHEIERYADFIGAQYILASVKTGENVDNVFKKIGEALYNNREPNVQNGTENVTSMSTVGRASI